jgi:flagellar assembly factor FliW
MITIDTKPYGKIEVDERQVLRFPEGLYGFEQLKEYCLFEAKERGPFFWLQSLEDKAVAFILIRPQEFHPGYEPRIPEAEYGAVGIKDPAVALVFAIVTIPKDPARMTANLTGPVIVDRETRIGAQFLSTNPDHRVKHLILEEMRVLGEPAEKTASC